MTINRNKIYVGIDVGKLQLDVFVSSINQHSTFENNSRGHKKLLNWLSTFDSPIELICMEATGGYEKRILNLFASSSWNVSRANAKWVRSFAKASGYLMKTDKIDARVIANYAEKMNPPIYKKTHKHQEELSLLCMRRLQLIKIRSAEKNRFEKCVENKSIKRSISRLMTQLNKEIEKIDLQIDVLLDTHQDIKKPLNKMMAIKGVGKKTAIVLLALLPELGQLNREQIAALAGVAPMNRDSGKHCGKRFTQGGRIQVRNALYMATLVATRFNPKTREFYQRLVTRGKPKKVAITACMRKLLIGINNLMKTHYNNLETNTFNMLVDSSK